MLNTNLVDDLRKQVDVSAASIDEGLDALCELTTADNALSSAAMRILIKNTVEALKADVAKLYAIADGDTVADGVPVN